MRQAVYQSHVNELREEHVPASATDRSDQVGYGPARLVAYPYVGPMDKECNAAAMAAGSLAELEQLQPKDHMEGILRGNRIVKLTMALEHNARDWLRYGESLYKNLNYEEARSAYLIGLCYADRFPELRAQLQSGVKNAEEKLARTRTPK